MSTKRSQKGISLFRTKAIQEKSTNLSNIYCWGEIPKGNGTYLNLFKENEKKEADLLLPPTELKTSNTSKPIISIAASENHVVCISNEFKMFGSGDNSCGQLLPMKQSTKNIAFAPLSELPILRKTLKVVQVACGRDFTAYLTNIGRVYTFGGNAFGQLAHSHDRRQSFIAPRMVQGIAHEIIVQVSCGDYSTYVLSKHGKVYAAGCGRNGRLGVANSNLFIKSKMMNLPKYISEMVADKNIQVKESYLEQNRAEMTEVGGPLKGSPIVSIAAGGSHCLAISNSGKVYGWGSNSFGQLGIDRPTIKIDDSDDDSDFDSTLLNGVPVPVCLDIADVSAIAAGRNHSLFVDHSRKVLYVAGDNRQKQLGPLDYEAVERILELKWEGLVNDTNVAIMKIACGSEHSAIVLSSGDVLVCGLKANIDINHDMKNAKVETLEKGVHLINGATAFNVACGGNMTYLLTSPDYVSLLAQGLKKDNLLKEMHPIGMDTENISTTKQSKELFMQLRKTLFDMQTLNASFLFPEINRKEQIETTLRESIKDDNLESSFLDIEGMLKATEVLAKAVYTDQEKLKIRQLVAHIVAQLEANAPTVTEADQLRAYLILTASPLLREICPAEHEVLLVSIFKLPVLARRLYFSWVYTDLACKDLNLLVDSLVKPMLKRLDNLVKKRKFTKQAVHLCKFLHCLYEICMKANEESEQRTGELNFVPKIHIASASFYTEALDSFPDGALDQMYRKWHSVVMKGGRELNGQQNDIAGMFGRPLFGEGEEGSNRVQRQNSDDSMKTVEQNNGSISGKTFGLKKFGLDFVSLVDNSLEDTLSNISPDLVFFKHPFLLSATTKRRFMRIDDNNMHTTHVLQFFSQAINPHLILEVGRGAAMIQDTFAKLRALMTEPAMLLRRPLKIKFVGEEGLDAGGVKKEFFLLLSQDLFSPDFNYFKEVNNNHLMWFNNVIDPYLFPNENQSVKYEEYLEAVKSANQHENRLEDLTIVGTIMGLAIYNDTLLDVQFPAAMYQLMLSKFYPENLDLTKYKRFDANGAKQLEYLKTITDKEELAGLDMRFEVTQEKYGTIKEIELCPSGSEKVVTFENLDEYIKCYIKFKMYSPFIEAQADALRNGFTKVISAQHAALKLFNTDELELLLCGTPELDFSTLKQVSSYEGGYAPTHKTVLMFWEILDEMDYEQRKKFLKFTTGSSRAPIGGLKNVKFKLQRAGPDSPQLPTSHTCFNTFMLPEYDSKEKMKRLILLAIENSEGFGLQ